LLRWVETQKRRSVVPPWQTDRPLLNSTRSSGRAEGFSTFLDCRTEFTAWRSFVSSLPSVFILPASDTRRRPLRRQSYLKRRACRGNSLLPCSTAHVRSRSASSTPDRSQLPGAKAAALQALAPSHITRPPNSRDRMRHQCAWSKSARLLRSQATRGCSAP
jgi:hypothetical protein